MKNEDVKKLIDELIEEEKLLDEEWAFSLKDGSIGRMNYIDGKRHGIMSVRLQLAYFLEK